MSAKYLRTGCTFVAASLLSLGLAAGQARAQEWPQDEDWEVLYCDRVPSFDPVGDHPEARDSQDVVGDASAPALYVVSDLEHMFFRMRVDANPLDDEELLRPFGWAVEMDLQLDLRTYELIVLVDGEAPSQVTLSRNTVQERLDDPADPPEQLVGTYPITSHARVVLAEEPFESNFGGDEDYFVDWAVPLEDLQAWGVRLDRPVALLMGTSDNGVSIDADLACFDGRDGRWSRAYTHAYRADGRLSVDSDGDGLSDDDELELGSDPNLTDSDGDGVDDGAEIIAGGDPADADDTGTPLTGSGLRLRGGGGPAGCSAAPAPPRHSPWAAGLLGVPLLLALRTRRRRD